MSALSHIATKRPLVWASLPPFDHIETPIPQKTVKEKTFLKKAIATGAKGCDLTDKALILSRLFIEIILETGNLIAKGYAKADKALRDLSSCTKIFSIFNVPFSLASASSMISSIWQSVKRKDHEGIAYSGLLLSLTIATIFDDITFSINGAIESFSDTTINWINNIAVPLGLTISSMVALTKCNRIYQLSKFNRELDRKILAIDSESMNGEKISSQKLRSLLIPFLTKNLGSNSSNLKAQTALERHTSAETLAQMKEIAELMDTHATLTDDQIDRILELLKSIKTSLQREKKLESRLLVATMISVLAYSLWLTPVAPAVPIVILAISITTQVGLKLHHKWSMEKFRNTEAQRTQRETG